MWRDREQNRRLRRVRERVRDGGISLVARVARGHFAWATVNQLRAVTELLEESHDEAEDCAYCAFAPAV